MVGYRNIITSKQKKGKTVRMYRPVKCALGNCFDVISKYEIKNKRLEEIVPESRVTKVYFSGNNYWFKTAKAIAVYELNEEGIKEINTIPKGTEFYPVKFLLQNGEPKYALIDIKDGDKKVGWINVEGNWYEDPIVENPVFGG